MFWENTKEESREIKRLNGVIRDMEKEIVEIRKDYEKSITNIKEDHKIVIARKDAELDVKVSEKIKTLADKVAKLELENGNYNYEEILRVYRF